MPDYITHLEQALLLPLTQQEHLSLSRSLSLAFVSVISQTPVRVRG